MKLHSPLLAAAALVCCASSGSAQIVPVGPFTGQHSDGFETKPAYIFTPCILTRMFDDTADLCCVLPPAPNGMIVVSLWSFICIMLPHSGGYFSAAADDFAEYNFDQPAIRFGGYFGTNSGIADGVAKFYDSANNLIGQELITAPTNCTWTWNGWMSTGLAFSRVTIASHYAQGGHMDMDDMEVDYQAILPAPVSYCTAKIGSLGCVPTLASNGLPSAAATSGFVVSSSHQRNRTPGLLQYSFTGRAATPFGGGLLCIEQPISRTPPQNSGGSPAPAMDCSGVYSIDMNAFAAGSLGGNPKPPLSISGTLVTCQFLGRDPGYPVPYNISFSNALAYTVGP